MANSKAKRIGRNILLTVLLLIVLIQFVRPVKNSSSGVSPNDIAQVYPMPDTIRQILHKACYDCHSSNTDYPWYNNIQPIAWWLSDHVDEGKRELNFSKFGSYTAKRQLKKLKEIVHEVEEGDMPLTSYTWMHKEAILSTTEQQLLTDWAKGLAQRIAVQPAWQQ